MSRLAPFSLRLTPEERSRLESQAGAMPLSSYIKSVVFAPEAPKYRRRRTPPVAEQQLLAVLPEVPRQRGAAAVARAGLQFGHRPALHRVARGHGRLVPHQPATETDQDRGACRPPRPRHHLPAGRGGRHRPDGPRHPRRDPPPSSATAMRMTEIKAQTERKRQDRSARRAEKPDQRTGMIHVRCLIFPTPGVQQGCHATRSQKRCLIGWVTLTPTKSLQPRNQQKNASA